MRTLLVLAVLGLSSPATADDSPLKVSADQVLDPDGTVTAAELDTAFAASSVVTTAGRCTGSGALLAWVVFENGKVIRAEGASSSDRGIEACVVKALRTAVIASKARVVATLRITVFARMIARGDGKVMDQIVDKNLTTNVGKFVGTGTGTGTGMRTGGGSSGPGVVPSGTGQPKIGFSAAEGELGGLTSQEIDRVIKSRAGIFRACYQRELNRTPGLAGKLVVKFEIGSDGSVGAASVASSTIRSDAVSTCVIAQFKRLKFPAKGATAVVTFPLMFSLD